MDKARNSLGENIVFKEIFPITASYDICDYSDDKAFIHREKANI